MLKFCYRNCPLNFTDHIRATEEECSVIDVDPSILTGLLRQGKIEQLVDLIERSYHQ